MTLTKHLYRHDEVVAAFVYSLKQRRFESHFWLYELEESGYQQDAKALLLVAWIMRVGLSRIFWLQHWSSVKDIRASRAILCEELLALTERDSSIWFLLWHGATSDTKPTMSLENALLEKNLTVAWWHLSRLDVPSFWTRIRQLALGTPLEALLPSLSNDLGTYEIFGRCTALAVLLTHSTIAITSWHEFVVPLTVNTREMYMYLDEFIRPISIKACRLHPIPWECLFGMTKRGSGQSTISELNDVEEHLLSSPTWCRLMKPYRTDDGLFWIGETGQVLFYEDYFPYEEGDIPDEWSRFEKNKSHGAVIPNVGNPVFSRWWRNWTIQERLYVWNKEASEIQSWMNDTLINLGESVFDTLNNIYEERFMIALSERS